MAANEKPNIPIIFPMTVPIIGNNFKYIFELIDIPGLCIISIANSPKNTISIIKDVPNRTENTLDNRFNFSNIIFSFLKSNYKASYIISLSANLLHIDHTFSIDILSSA